MPPAYAAHAQTVTATLNAGTGPQSVAANPVTNKIYVVAHTSKITNRLPAFRDITIRNVRVEGRGKVTLEGIDETHRLGIRFDNVIFDNPSAIKVSAKHADVNVGPGPFNLKMQGAGVNLLESAGQVAANACDNKFVPFPAR